VAYKKTCIRYAFQYLKAKGPLQLFFVRMLCNMLQCMRVLKKHRGPWWFFSAMQQKTRWSMKFVPGAMGQNRFRSIFSHCSRDKVAHRNFHHVPS